VPNKIQFIAHRGVSGLAPENTISAFNLAVKMGFPMIELDVQMTRDQQLVVIHDSTVNRTTNGAGAVADFRLAELRQLDAGSWFGREFSGEKIPTLLEVIHEVGGHCRLNIEVKKVNTGHSCRPIEEALIEALSEGVSRQSYLVSSFDYAVLTRIHKLAPHIKLANLFSYLPLNLPKRIAAGILTAIHPHYFIVSKRMIETAHAHGLQVNVWTVDKPEQILSLIDLGVDGIITNYPKAFL
jgi:glycerophosphoryl diester phosphodiesterase